MTIGGVAQHLISYYKIEDVEQGRLRSPSSLPELASLTISPEYLDKTHFRNPPKVEIGVDGVPRYRGEADDADTSPRLLPAPLATTTGTYYPDTDAGSSKRAKRYDPYPTTSPTATQPKRSRKKNNSAGSQQEATGDSPVATSSPTATTMHPSSQPAYAESAVPPPPHYAPYGYYPVAHSYPPPHAYSPAPYPPPTTAATPPQESPSPPPATPAYPSASTYAAESSSSSAAPPPAAVYPSYYPHPAPHYGYSMPWGTHYHGGYAASSSHGAPGTTGASGGQEASEGNNSGSGSGGGGGGSA